MSGNNDLDPVYVLGRSQRETEVVTQSSVVFGPVMIGTWAHKTSWWG
jgi:hypothetical protein